MGAAEVLIPITFFLSVALVFISRGEIGKAIAHSIRARAGGADVQELRVELADMRQELDQVRQELLETHERLDFSERLLARSRTPDQLPGG